MIAFLQGNVLMTDEDSVVLNVRGVGYEVFMSAQSLIQVVGLPSAQLWIHTVVREDALQLYGFLARAEKDLFLSLLKVNGVGPKGAMKILSGASFNSLVQMIDDGDATALSKLPKVGKKTAEQIILQLKGKLVLAGETDISKSGFAARSEIISALTHLGFKATEVEKAVDKMDATTDLEEGVRKGLGMLTAQF
jgi:Holliday junction DNA helicase RuvA